MKTLSSVLTVFICIFFSCNSEVKTINENPISFGIYGTVKNNEIPGSVIDTLRTMNVQPDNNLQQSVIGYISKSDTSVLQFDFSKENFKLVRTYYTVDNDKKYYAIYALKPGSEINTSGIKKTKANGKIVEIYFNMKGANEWAGLTSKNIGSTVVFVINNQVYAATEINGEIKNGTALINNLENELMAKKISRSLNSGIGK